MGLLNIGAGLAEAGKAVSAFAGAWTLQAQKDDAEKEKLALMQAFQAGENEKQRGFQTSERVETQKYQSGEKALDRTQQMDIVKMQMENAVKTAQISAGPGYASVAQRAREFEAGAPMREAQTEAIKADTEQKKAVTGSYEEERKSLIDQRKAQTEAYSAETLLRSIQADAAKNVLEARKELDAATASKDAAAIERARQKLYVAEFSTKDEVQQVSLAQTQARLWKDAMTATEARIVALQQSADRGLPSEASEKLIKDLTKELEDQRRAYNAAATTAEELRKRQQVNLTPRPTEPRDESRPRPTIRFQYDSKGNRIKD